jgi:two-component system sensor histidine kinase/response regulator
MSAEGESSTDFVLPAQAETHRQKTMRAHLRYLRHEVRTPINAIIGYGEMLADECPPALLPTVIADIGRLLVTARRMTHVIAEVLSQVDGDPQLERCQYHNVTVTLAEALSSVLDDCMQSCELIMASARAHGDDGEFSADLFKISSACQQLFTFLAAAPTPLSQPYESPVSTLTAVDPTGAFAIAQSVHPRGVLGASSEPALSVILVVDDSAANRTILQRRLSQHGYRVEEAKDGTSALARLASGGIDLVLLDVLLPDIDGLTLCRTLKSNPLTVAIPVLLVTALHERQDRLAGIAAGANDFLSKPIDSQDLLLRCRNALAAKRQYDQTVTAYRKLQQLEELRDRLTHLIVHDMRSPLSGLIGYLDLFIARSPGQVDERLRHLVEKATLQAHSLEGLINHVLDVSRLEAGAMPLNRERHDLVHLARMAVAALGSAVERVPVRIMAPATGLPVVGDGDLIRRVYINLLSNALRYAPDGSEVVLSLSLNNKCLRSEVLDDGPGIALENQQRIFEKFNQVKTVPVAGKSVTSGLGLTFCKLAIEAHGGSIGVQSTLGQGCVFWFTLPT